MSRLEFIKDAARVATTTNIVLSGLQVIDGIQTVNNDRVLVKNQTNAVKNGIYSAKSGAWQRTDDARKSKDLPANTYLFISEGASQSDTGWVLVTNNPIAVETTPLVFAEFTLKTSDIDARIQVQKGVANGIATLDATGKVPESELPTNISSDVIAELQDNIMEVAFQTQLIGAVSVLKFTDSLTDEFVDQSGIDIPNCINQTYDAINTRYTPAGGADSNIVLALHLDGTNNSTVITDSSISSKVVTAYGNAVLSTAQSVFGGASLFFTGVVGDYLQTANSPDFNFDGDFTIHLRYRLTNTGGSQDIIGNGYSTGWMLEWYSPDSHLYFYHANSFLSCIWTPVVNTWYHIAIVRYSNTITMYVDGVAIGSEVYGTAITSTKDLFIGKDADEYAPVHGYVDEVIISKGVALWQSNFTPPTDAYMASSPSSMTLISKATTASTAPASSRLIVRETDIDPVTINTDLLAFVSRDDGTTYSQVPLSLIVQSDVTKNIYAGNVDLSSQPSGTSLRYKIVTANSKRLEVQAVGLSWKA